MAWILNVGWNVGFRLVRRIRWETGGSGDAPI